MKELVCSFVEQFKINGMYTFEWNEAMIDEITILAVANKATRAGSP